MASSLRDRFVDRHVGPDQPEQTAMLDVLGFESLDALTDAAVPAVIRRSEPLALPAPRSEVETIAALRALADRNVVATSMIGMGYSDTITPGVIRRNVLENPAWYTAYTPYQPEISQGRLEALLDFQTMVADLTGMDLANASLLDEATAAAEAMAMCRRLAPKGGDIFFLDADCHPQTIAVVKGRAEPLDIEVVVGDPAQDVPGARVFGVLLAYPGSSGAVVDHSVLIARVHDEGGLVAVTADLLALVLLQPPGAMGAADHGELRAGLLDQLGVSQIGALGWLAVFFLILLLRADMGEQAIAEKHRVLGAHWQLHAAVSLSAGSRSATRNSPDIRRGSRRSRVWATVRDSVLFASMRSRLAETALRKASNTSALGMTTSVAAIASGLIAG